LELACFIAQDYFEFQIKAVLVSVRIRLVDVVNYTLETSQFYLHESVFLLLNLPGTKNTPNMAGRHDENILNIFFSGSQSQPSEWDHLFPSGTGGNITALYPL
jgi:hypothetical protein